MGLTPNGEESHMASLHEGMNWLVHEKQVMHSLSVAFGSDAVHFKAYMNADKNTIYDLASLTKLFTLIAVMKLNEAGQIDLAGLLGDYDKRFVNMKRITIMDILSYRARITTVSRMDVTNRESALRLLFEASHIPDDREAKYYSDMNAMVLKYVVESVAGIPFFAYLSREILKPLNMTRTFAAVPDDALTHLQSYDKEHRVINGERVVFSHPICLPHDPKAALLSPDGTDLCGHAGLFSTLDDMTLLCAAILKGEVLSPKSLAAIAVNRTGYQKENGQYSQYLGYICFVKHPQQYYSEVPEYMTHSAFGLSGFTGNHLSIDPSINVFNVFLGNRCFNRLTVISPMTPVSLTELDLCQDGTGMVKWAEGEIIPSSVNSVHQKDEKLHKPIYHILLREGLCQ